MRIFVIVLLNASSLALNAQPFRDEIQSFLHADSINPPLPGQVLFVGSSSFRLWKDIESYFPGVPILNRGFGGSCLPDLIRYEKQVIRPYNPRQIVIYCGENDFAASDTVDAKDVLERFQTLFKIIRSDFPHTPIVYVAMKPSPSRRHLMNKVAEGNRLIQRYLRNKRQTHFVDVYHKMLDAKGEPMPELFLEDQLHMNRVGYMIWQKALEPILRR